MKSIRRKLSLATCCLLSQGVATAAEIDNDWETDSSLLHYSEVERVSVTELTGLVSGAVSDSDAVVLNVVFDTMSGATPTGAVRQSTPTFTGASGGGISPSASSAALATFDDTRMAINLDWTHQQSRLLDIAYNGAISIENDYRSFSTGVKAEKETTDRINRYTAGIAFTWDNVFRVGENATPAPLSLVSDDNFFGGGDKNSVDAIVGVTHVINRRTLGQLNLGYGLSKGYLTDPYKVFSVVGNSGVELEQYYEKRPGSRNRFTLAGNIIHQLDSSEDIINAGYRFYSDDWDINSHTINFRFRHKLPNNRFVEPKVRVYSQNKASFYHNAIVNDPADMVPTSSIMPDYVSADYRLDSMWDITLGMTYGFTTKTKGDFRARIEYLYQSFDNSEFDTNKAVIAQISYKKRF